MALTHKPHILIVAGSDSSGGAGIARDVETACALGVRTALALTAVTVQTHEKVLAIEPVAPALIMAQMKSAITANSIMAIKIGMLGTADAAEALGRFLAQNPAIPAVFDPVLAASSGDALTRDNLCAAILRQVLPYIDLITPNLSELAQLSRCPLAQNDEIAIVQGKKLLELGATQVLVKGGHAEGEQAIDYLITPNCPPLAFSKPRLRAIMRGTGCTLSSAIAAELAKGNSMKNAIETAKTYLTSLLENHQDCL